MEEKVIFAIYFCACCHIRLGYDLELSSTMASWFAHAAILGWVMTWNYLLLWPVGMLGHARTITQPTRPKFLQPPYQHTDYLIQLRPQD